MLNFCPLTAWLTRLLLELHELALPLAEEVVHVDHLLDHRACPADCLVHALPVAVLTRTTHMNADTNAGALECCDGVLLLFDRECGLALVPVATRQRVVRQIPRRVDCRCDRLVLLQHLLQQFDPGSHAFRFRACHGGDGVRASRFQHTQSFAVLLQREFQVRGTTIRVSGRALEGIGSSVLVLASRLDVSLECLLLGFAHALHFAEEHGICVLVGFLVGRSRAFAVLAFGFGSFLRLNLLHEVGWKRNEETTVSMR